MREKVHRVRKRKEARQHNTNTLTKRREVGKIMLNFKTEVMRFGQGPINAGTLHKEFFLTCELLNSEKYKLSELEGYWITSLCSSGYELRLFSKKGIASISDEIKEKANSFYKKAREEAEKMVKEGHPYWSKPSQ